MNKRFFYLLAVFWLLANHQPAEAKRRRYRGPQPVHPVVLWAKTVAQGTDLDERRKAAFKLSQYSQTMFQEEVVNTLLKCIKDPDVQIKVFCCKAMSHAGKATRAEVIRKALLEQYHAEPSLRNTIVRTFTVRKDKEPVIQDTFLEAAKNADNNEELLVTLNYLELYGNGTDKFIDSLAEIYKKNDNAKVKTAVVKALTERGKGQDTVIALLAQCADSKDTPLLLTCLSGLQQQAKKDTRAWSAVEKTIESSDPDVVMATLDVINSLPENPNLKISNHLVEITTSVEDEEIQEKAILALGVAGDQNQAIVNVLQKTLEDTEKDDGTRIAAALVLGKQGASFPEKPKALLSKCKSAESSQPLKEACKLGSQELETRKPIVTQTPQSPTPEPSKVSIPEKAEEKAERDAATETTEGAPTETKTP